MGERVRHRDQIAKAQNQVAATLYVGDALHRLAKAVEMLLDPEQVEARRYHNSEPAGSTGIDEQTTAEQRSLGRKVAAILDERRPAT